MSFIFLSFVFSVSLFASPLQERGFNPVRLSELLSFFQISEEEDVVSATQDLWLRKPGQERWDMAELSSEQSEYVLKWAEEQGMFCAWKPSCESYDQALILGATTSTMERRLEYLSRLWEEGVRFREVVWLTGERPLNANVDNLLDRCQTESEAAKVLWREGKISEEMRLIPVLFISVPMKEGGKRPTTEDTIRAWLYEEKEPGRALFVSNQPFCGYQFSVIKAVLPEATSFDVVGEGGSFFSAAVILDSIARQLYIQQRPLSGL